jgi:cyclohexanecarboxylate-CoA ligase
VVSVAFAKVTDRYSSEQIERYYATGVWRAATLFDELEAQVAIRPDKVFITDGTAAYTFGQLRAAALRLAAGLSRLGIGAGARVVVQLPNWTEFAVVTTALSRLGAIMVPVMPVYRSDDVRFVVETAGANAAFTPGVFRGFDHARMFGDLAAAGTGLQTVIAVRADPVPDGALAFEDLLAGRETGEALPASGIGPDDPFAVVFSSGTTSRPKGCLHTFNTYCASARLMGEAYHYTDADVQFGPSPVTHSTGLVTSILMPLVHGAGSHLMDIWEPREGLERIAKFRCTASVTATTFLQTLLTVSLYGRSENLCTTLCSIDDDPERSVTSDGRAASGQEVRVVDEHGHEVPRGTEGDIAFRGASNLLEYIGQPEATAEMFTADGFSKSGDLGVMDAGG